MYIPPGGLRGHHWAVHSCSRSSVPWPFLAYGADNICDTIGITFAIQDVVSLLWYCQPPSLERPRKIGESALSLNFGEKLRKRRVERGITLERLAEIVGTRKSYIWQLENKKPARPSGELLIKLANALDISGEFLIDDRYDMPSDMHVGIALARGASERGLKQEDIDKLFEIADTINGKTRKRSK